LDQFLIMSRGEKKQNGRHDWYILSCALEAVCGATFIDSGGGYLVVKKILRKHLLTDQLFQSVNVKNLADFDPKSNLQRIAQAKFDITPSYKVVDVSGPDDAKQYTVWAMLGENRVGAGIGRSKQEGQKNAATDALQQTNYLSGNLPFGALRARAILNDLIPERE